MKQTKKTQEKRRGLTAIEKIEKLGKKVASMTQAELARAVGVSRERVRQLVPRMKVKPGQRIVAWHRKVSRAQRLLMMKMQDDGVPLSDIAQKYGVSEYHVREAIRLTRAELNITRGRGRPRKQM
jgi:DNA-binding transcriptional regulator LsrR (DeoR family)